MEFHKSYISVIVCVVVFLNVTIHILLLHILSVDKKDKTVDNDTFREYLIYNSKCKIPDFDSYDRYFSTYMEKMEYVPCWRDGVFTRIIRKHGKAFLVVRTTPSYSQIVNQTSLSCCYCNVTPDASTRPDYEIEVSACVFFENIVQVTNDVIYVKCYANEKLVYENVHAITVLNGNISDILDGVGISKSPNVLMLGLSSVARFNFHRVFPGTYSLLKEQQWIEYTAFNVIGDETNVNLRAMLTGKFNASCDSNDSFATDSDFIWREFQKMGYITTYLKDSIDNGVLQNSKMGFQSPPTDIYFRHYVIATHMLFKSRVHDSVYCTGPETIVERILNIAKDLLAASRRQNSFSLFWMDGFDRRDVRGLLGLDAKLKNFFVYLQRSGILRNTIVLFLSDRGDELLPAKTLKGWYARRLSFLYIWIPPTFRRRYPEKYKTILANRHGLTTPFDIFLTMQDILVTYFEQYDARKSQSCSECFSLFTKNSYERSCQQAAIGNEWCSCLGYKKLQNHASNLAKLTENFIITEAKREIKKQINDSCICQEIKSKGINHIWLAENHSAFDHEGMFISYLMVSVDTNLGIVLEGTVLVKFENETSSFEMVDQLSGMKEWSVTSNYCLQRFILSYPLFILLFLISS